MRGWKFGVEAIGPGAKALGLAFWGGREVCGRGDMKQIKITGKRAFFEVLHSTRNAQVAISALRKGQATSDEPTNEHPGSEQWV